MKAEERQPEVILRKWGDYWTAQVLVGNRRRAYSIRLADGQMVEIPGPDTPFVMFQPSDFHQR